MVEQDWTKIFDNQWKPEKFPDEYEIKDEIKSPLNVLWYNMNFEFKDNYPAKMSEDFARDMIKIYSKPDDLVWDGCCGSGVVPREAARLGRKAIGSDINPKAIELCLKHKEDAKTGLDVYFVGDVRDFWIENLKGTRENGGGVDLILSSFPFGTSIIGDKNNYSELEKDMSNSKDFDEFFEKIEVGIANYYKQLVPGGVMILDARDRTKEGRYIDTINYFRNSALLAGFKMVCRYTYFLMPWSHYTFFNKPTGKAVPMISTMDTIVMYKPVLEDLNVS